MQEDDIILLGNQLKKQFSNLPDPVYWSKYGKIRLYFNAKGPDGSDMTFSIDFTSGNPVLWNYIEPYWTKKGLSSKSEFDRLIINLYQSSRPSGTQSVAVDFSSVEIFPVNKDVLPEMHAYRIDTGGENVEKVGGKLSFVLRKKLPGSWVWSKPHVITDRPSGEDELERIIAGLWQSEPDTYRDLRGVTPVTGWKPTVYDQATFVIQARLPDHKKTIYQYLSNSKRDLGNATIERVYSNRAWSVHGEPAISFSISSKIIFKQDLKSYASTLSSLDDLIGIQVGVKDNPSSKGEIIAIAGQLKDHRKRLVSVAKHEKTRKKLQEAPDDELVVTVLMNRRKYDYLISALNIIVSPADYRRFHINGREALKIMKIPPVTRLSMISHITSPLLASNIILPAYDSTSCNHFLSSSDVNFKPELRFGGNIVSSCEGSEAWNHLVKYGVYQKLDKYRDGAPVTIALLDALLGMKYQRFLDNLQKEMNKTDFSIDIVSQKSINDLSRIELEKSYHELAAHDPDIILGLFPDYFGSYDEHGEFYHPFKDITVGQGTASQVVQAQTLDKYYALGNIVLGILGKTGNIPYVLADPLPYADYIVGIDIARDKKKDLPGTISTTAITRIYFGNGQFLRYVIHDAPIEGETVPDHVLQKLFPVKDFQGKRVIVHRDGYFRGDEKQCLKDWGRKMGATIHPVEVIKSGSPRVYSTANGSVGQPVKGTTFKINEYEALLVSTLPPFENATPLPLRITCEQPLTIEKAIHSVLSLTLLHYGSVRQPKLPVTIHYSDKIAGLALRGIKPKDLEGSLPFWL
ncbi:MAG: Piwi domain-containing protein [Candidatus Odinarchaeota archaeon]